MSPRPYIIELDPETKTKLKMYLFTNVQNTEVIKNNIISGVWSCAGIKPGFILDPFQVAVAANRAVVSEKSKTMVTKSVYAEILYNLSLTKKITNSLSTFGIDNDVDILLCFLETDVKDSSQEIISQIVGESCDIEDLYRFRRMDNVKRIYKLNNFKNDYEGLLDLVVSRMVTKNFVSH